MKGIRILERAIETVRERGAAYGDASAFYARLARRWSVTLGMEVTPQQVVLCMMDLKLERLCGNPAHIDSLIDLPGYTACLAEVALKEAHHAG